MMHILPEQLSWSADGGNKGLFISGLGFPTRMLAMLLVDSGQI